MKTLNITYDTTEIEENGKPIAGETCCNLKLRDELADQLLRTGRCDPISRPAPDSRIVEERGIDGYIELVQLPNELDKASKADADEWFRWNRYYEFYPTAYDCSGQRFTNWYKLHRRCGHWFAYHSVSFDV